MENSIKNKISNSIIDTIPFINLIIPFLFLFINSLPVPDDRLGGSTGPDSDRPLLALPGY